MIEMPNDAQMEQIAHVASEPDAKTPFTAAQVGAILAAYRNVMGGDPVGTLRRDPKTGAVAVRANVDGLHMWRVSSPDGTQWNDLQPTLAGWEQIA